MNYQFDVYMLCPVRNATEEQKIFLENYKRKLEAKKLKVHYAADTPQKDETGGLRICMDHCDEILNSRAVHVYWTGTSQGSYVDLGKSLIEHKRRGLDILLMNRDFVEELVKKQKEEQGLTKSYEMVLLSLDNIADPFTKAG